MTALVGILCDGGCGQRRLTESYGQVSTTRVREKAKAEGWHKTLRDGIARDICPACWEAGTR